MSSEGRVRVVAAPSRTSTALAAGALVVLATAGTSLLVLSSTSSGPDRSDGGPTVAAPSEQLPPGTVVVPPRPGGRGGPADVPAQLPAGDGGAPLTADPQPLLLADPVPLAEIVPGAPVPTEPGLDPLAPGTGTAAPAPTGPASGTPVSGPGAPEPSAPGDVDGRNDPRPDPRTGRPAQRGTRPDAGRPDAPGAERDGGRNPAAQRREAEGTVRIAGPAAETRPEAAQLARTDDDTGRRAHLAARAQVRPGRADAAAHPNGHAYGHAVAPGQDAAGPLPGVPPHDFRVPAVAPGLPPAAAPPAALPPAPPPAVRPHPAPVRQHTAPPRSKHRPRSTAGRSAKGSGSGKARAPQTGQTHRGSGKR